MPYVWDYRTGDVIDAETGEVVDRIYTDDLLSFSNREDTLERRHYDLLVPTVRFGASQRRRFSKLKAVVMEILGRPLTSVERVRLARWLLTARKMSQFKRKDMWLHVAVYMFLTDIGVDPNRHVPMKAALAASSVTRPNRYAMVLRKINECLTKLGRPHLREVAAEVARVLFERYPSMTGGKSAAKIAAISVYMASVMTEEDPLTKDSVSSALGIGDFRQRKVMVVGVHPFTVEVDREICEAVSRRARLHQRVICVDRSRRNGPGDGTGPGDGGPNQPGAGR